MSNEQITDAGASDGGPPAWRYPPSWATVILWLGLLVATTIILGGTAYFGQLLPIYTTVGFIQLLVVEATRRRQGRPDT